MKVKLESYNQAYMYDAWVDGHREDHPEWKNWDGPYFDDDYQSYPTYEEFFDAESKDFDKDTVKFIVADGKPVGNVTMYWKDKKTRWLEIGLIIYDPKYWSKGIGTEALKLWIDHVFKNTDNLEHVGLTTWSGNHRMMKAAEKVGMKKEAQIRKVRYHNDVFYDSVSYGVLREEWEEIDS